MSEGKHPRTGEQLVEQRVPHEYKTARRLGGDYWLYVVFHCATTPQLHVVQDAARLGWKPVVAIEHYAVGVGEILGGSGEQ